MQTLALKKKRNFMNFTSTSSTSYMLIILVNCFKYNLGNVEKPRKKKEDPCISLETLVWEFGIAT